MKTIMFNEPFGLQQATFDRTKTMTRRVALKDPVEDMNVGYDTQTQQCIICSGNRIVARSMYAVGEVVAVAQAYKYIYQFDCVPTWVPSTKDPSGFIKWDESKGYSNKMYVKAEYMPHHIKITGIKVEGLVGISDEDCLKEGIYELKLCESEKCVYTFQGDRCGMWKTPYYAYKELIDRLNKRGFFESNPLVFAYTYELVD